MCACVYMFTRISLYIQSSQVEITRLYEERKELVAACEELSAERDNKNNLLKKHEKVCVHIHVHMCTCIYM